ncbi:hypothetical protein CQA53_04645 [Helicobacter didelphidarum]|uniref:Uncharacterized protein n=1 Tax=Helicobacter didelphidarum TaxID=2040648 RepID=A0A3D8IN82_9HELI|nr:hypothetical protein [Helicobacter didelphidarum]RDU66094.1 hypothetical protein CQA53_04645 [Helicobacter didelphidarum]
MNKNDSKEQPIKFKIQYYRKDNIRSINAFVRNKIEKDMLKVLKNIAEILQIHLQVESETSVGGLIEILTLHIDFPKNYENSLPSLQPHIADILAYYLSYIDGDSMIDDTENLFKNKKIQRLVSNFYQKISKYDKIEKICYKIDGSERFVKKIFFTNFILANKRDIEIDNHAIIEIISPILQEGNYKWRGKYKDEKIDFIMADSLFQQEVIASKYEFTNGSFLQCNLEVTRTFDEYGDESKLRSYKVLKVYEFNKEGLLNNECYNTINNNLWNQNMGEDSKIIHSNDFTKTIHIQKIHKTQQYQSENKKKMKKNEQESQENQPNLFDF